MREKFRMTKNVILSEKGLVNDSVWESEMKDYPTTLVRVIRERLVKEIPAIKEKVNTYMQCYFGYWKGQDKDRAYLYLQDKCLRIDLCISRDNEEAIKEAGFKVHFVNNYQGIAGWLTGWQVPHNTENIDTVMKWLCMAFR
jgi:spermidine/putrescine-binding protein